MKNEKNTCAEPIVLGALHGAYGVKGWFRVQPFQGVEALLSSKHWQHVLPSGKVQAMELEAARQHGAGIVAKVKGIDNPEQAKELKGAVALFREDFPETAEDEFYWVDLIGCEVVNEAGEKIGSVKGLIDNGVHDILEVKKDDGKVVLIPFIDTYLHSVDVDNKKVTVDWDLDWD